MGITITLIILLFILVVILHCKRSPMRAYDDEDETITTTTTAEVEEPQINIVGNLKRQFEGIQSFVIDPVDQQKIWLNSNDDRYEDANGKIWRLV